MNFQKRLPIYGGLAILAGITLLLVNSRALEEPKRILETIGWALTGFGTLGVLVGLAPPQIFSIFAIPEYPNFGATTRGFYGLMFWWMAYIPHPKPVLISLNSR